MNYRSFNLGDWIDHISGAIEDETTLDGNEMRDLVEFLTALKQEPTTKNDLGVDCISREQALEPYKILENTDTLSVYTIRQNLAELPSMGRYDPYTDKFIGEE